MNPHPVSQISQLLQQGKLGAGAPLYGYTFSEENKNHECTLTVTRFGTKYTFEGIGLKKDQAKLQAAQSAVHFFDITPDIPYEKCMRILRTNYIVTTIFESVMDFPDEVQRERTLEIAKFSFNAYTRKGIRMPNLIRHFEFRAKSKEHLMTEVHKELLYQVKSNALEHRPYIPEKARIYSTYDDL